MRNVAMLVGVASLFCGLSLFGYEQGLFRFAYPDMQLYPVRGIDVSHHQGDIDWSRLPLQGIGFAYLKATEGGDWVDPKFLRNIRDAQAQGIPVGAYHFFTLCRSGIEQAANFISTLRPAGALSLPPAIDLEYQGNCRARPSRVDFAYELKGFVRELSSHFSSEPVFYSTSKFYYDYLATDEFADHPLWVRDIFGPLSWPEDGNVLIRQFSNNGRMHGVRGRVDLNHFVGDESTFTAWTARSPR